MFHLTPPSFKCTPALRVGGSAHQQLHHQRVLGASTPDRPERPHTGVQGETRDAQDRSGSGDGRGKKRSGTDCSGSLAVCTGSNFLVDTLMKYTDFNDQLGISHRLVSAATGTCARKELFLSSMTVPVICLFHQKHQVLIIFCAQTQRCLLIIGGGQKKHGRTHSSIILIYSSHLFVHFRRVVPNSAEGNQQIFLISGRILHLVMWEHQYLSVSSVFPQVWCLSSGVQPEEQINRTVDRTVLSVLLTGLLPDTPYTVTVAAVTGLGVGTQSPPINLLSKSMRTSIRFRTKVEQTDHANSCLSGVNTFQSYANLR